MISLAAALVLTTLSKQADYNVICLSEEGVWVYPNASDPGGDETFKIWGIGGNAVAPTPAESESFGYGYVKFNFSSLPADKADKKVTSAYMIVNPSGSPEPDKDAKSHPLEVRPLNGKFSEKTWTYDMASTVNPSTKEIYGTGIIDKVAGSTDPKALEIKMDLMGKNSNFSEALMKSIKSKEPMFLALVSKYDASESGRQGIYRIIARDRAESSVQKRPRIYVKFE